MKILQSIILDFGRDTIPVTVFAKQGDTESRFVEITPVDRGKDYTPEEGVTARLQLTTPDGRTVFNDAEIADGKITVELTNNALAAAGMAVAEIGLYRGTALLTSQVFYIHVERAAMAAASVEGSDEYGSFVEALAAVDGAVRACETAAEAANTAASGAARATGEAHEAASSANTAAESANKAAGTANTAAGKADTSANKADEAAESANTAAKAAAEAAEAAAGAEKVDISAKQTLTGADVTVTNRRGEQTTVHIDTIFAVETWADIRNAVRLGTAERLFPPGYEFSTKDSDTGATVVWVVRGHNRHKAANDKLTNTMTLETKVVYGDAAGTYKGVVFDAQEALYYAESELAAGTYHFTVANQAWYAGDNGKSYQFTLAKSVPAGGQIYLAATYNQAMAGKAIWTYAGPASSEAIESTTVSEGNAGTSLGTTDGNGGMNYLHRIILGSNNYAQSAARQWLNSAEAAGAVWAPTNRFDRAPTWAATYPGFMHGLPADFLEVVQSAILPCRTNSVYETDSLDGTSFSVNQVYTVEDKFFLLSRPEIYGTWDSATYKDGELLEYYEGLTNAERIKRDAAGVARTCWLRSPTPGYASDTRVVYTDGTVGSNNAFNAIAVAPACIIA